MIDAVPCAALDPWLFLPPLSTGSAPRGTAHIGAVPYPPRRAAVDIRSYSRAVDCRGPSVASAGRRPSRGPGCRRGWRGFDPRCAVPQSGQRPPCFSLPPPGRSLRLPLPLSPPSPSSSCRCGLLCVICSMYFSFAIGCGPTHCRLHPVVACGLSKFSEHCPSGVSRCSAACSRLRLTPRSCHPAVALCPAVGGTACRAAKVVFELNINVDPCCYIITHVVKTHVYS